MENNKLIAEFMQLPSQGMGDGLHSLYEDPALTYNNTQELVINQLHTKNPAGNQNAYCLHCQVLNVRRRVGDE